PSSARATRAPSGRERHWSRPTPPCPPDHWIVGNLRSVLASNLLLQGELDAALEQASAGEALISAATAPVQPSIVRENLELLLRIHEARNDPSAAAPYREKLEALNS